jgi:hypothetical protein
MHRRPLRRRFRRLVAGSILGGAVVAMIGRSPRPIEPGGDVADIFADAPCVRGTDDTPGTSG